MQVMQAQVSFKSDLNRIYTPSWSNAISYEKKIKILYKPQIFLGHKQVHFWTLTTFSPKPNNITYVLNF